MKTARTNWPFAWPAIPANVGFWRGRQVIHAGTASCNVDLSGVEVSGNGTTIASLASGHSFSGGLWFGATDKAYSVKLRNVAVVDNTSLANGNTNTTDNSGITLAGTAASS